jgi:hypothetical protein
MAMFPAERVRSILARAASAHVTRLAPSPGRPTMSAVPARIELLTTEAAESPEPVVVEVADPAPLPVPDRIRARVRISGHGVVSTTAGQPLLLLPTAVHLLSAGGDAAVSPVELARATPDPLTHHEGDLLSHLDHAHPQLMETLTGLVAAHLLDGVTRVWPLELDSRGIVLRLQHGRRHHDVRLGFPTAATCPQEALARVRTLTVLGAGRHRCRQKPRGIDGPD